MHELSTPNYDLPTLTPSFTVSCIGFVISYVRLNISYVGLTMSCVGIVISYVRLDKHIYVAPSLLNQDGFHEQLYGYIYLRTFRNQTTI